MEIEDRAQKWAVKQLEERALLLVLQRRVEDMALQDQQVVELAITVSEGRNQELLGDEEEREQERLAQSRVLKVDNRWCRGTVSRLWRGSVP